MADGAAPPEGELAALRLEIARLGRAAGEACRRHGLTIDRVLVLAWHSGDPELSIMVSNERDVVNAAWLILDKYRDAPRRRVRLAHPTPASPEADETEPGS